MRFEEMFEKAAGFPPYPYQTRMATSNEMPSLVSVPTGLGKTAATVLSWLWRRKFAGEQIRGSTPRRLVYCLPMRVLVEQTHDCAVKWLKQLDLLGGGFDGSGKYDPFLVDDDPRLVRVHMLMGGDVDRDWDRYPERDAILVGTQDMLLSRALNRGYAMSRFRWPMQFGLLNNDCLWVMDEVQLMGNGLATTTQLQAFRRKLGTVVGVQSIWMSATMRPEWLHTVDFDPEQDAKGNLEVLNEDKTHEKLRPRFEALKPLGRADFTATKNGKKEAALAVDHHSPGKRTRTLVVVNTVKRAQNVFQKIQEEARKRGLQSELVLIHSRFRPPERAKQIKRLLDDPGEHGTIAVSTQVVEAGVDVSARTLITDLAPWASMVQRFGRCNREGEFNESRDASVIWIEPPDLKNEKKLMPYSAEEMQGSAARLSDLGDVGARNLPAVEELVEFGHVIRRKDLVELFDTTPDLAGADIDVSRFIREADEHSVQVFWRDRPKEDDDRAGELGPSRAELCSVPVGELRDWLKKKGRSCLRWDHLDRRWERQQPQTIYPGLVLMLDSAQGGYDTDLGWIGSGKHTDPLEIQGEQLECDGKDGRVEAREWATVAEHTDGVVKVVEGLLDTIGPDLAAWRAELLEAARWHDAGKAHEVFQNAMPADGERVGGLWAKCESGMKRYERLGFRHELASAIAMLQNGFSDLAAYLAASHHGKVRLSIRSLPHELHPPDPSSRFARGIWEGDVLKPSDLGNGVLLPETVIDLSVMELGEGPNGPSWLARMLVLRDALDLGPFRLALLEALLRVADWRASDGRAARKGEEVK